MIHIYYEFRTSKTRYLKNAKADIKEWKKTEMKGLPLNQLHTVRITDVLRIYGIILLWLLFTESTFHRRKTHLIYNTMTHLQKSKGNSFKDIANIIKWTLGEINNIQSLFSYDRYIPVLMSGLTTLIYI